MREGEELDTAIMAVREELDENADSVYGEDYAAGYRQALEDTLANLELLRRSMRGR